jgi:beta-lactamase superfamily II metal-dependent hydrolase
MSDFFVHCLDVGAFNYGDSILCEIGGRTILIDGGTPRSGQPSAAVVAGEDVAHQPIQQQVRDLLGQSGTPEVDLLVVTHCHADHIGSLPTLFADGELTCRWALLADPQLGYGITTDSDEPPSAQDMSADDKLWLALREEPLFDATDEQIEAFIEDAAREYEAYVTFVNGLREDLGSKCVVYRGPTEALSAGLTALLDEFQATGLQVYGPSFDLLLACAERLEGRSEDLIEDALEDNPPTLVEAYRNAVERLVSQDAEDSNDGAAVNCQSLVLRVGPDDHKVLLTGDTQFASPAVGDGTPMVKALLATVTADGPFECVKLSHHGATNGQNRAILEEWGAKHLIVSTGSTSSKHPTEAVLTALEQLESDGFEWARVDMNGRCTFAVRNGQARLEVERLELNDTTRPAARSGDAVAPRQPREAEASTSAAAGSIVTTGAADGSVEVHIKVPHTRTRIAFTLEIDPGGSSGPFAESIARSGQPTGADARRLGGGRELSRLLFVTDRAALGRRIGQSDADAILGAVRAARHLLVDGRGPALLAEARRRLEADRALTGVVLLGGYDVVPSQILNTLPRELAAYEIRDRDRLQVWSDDGYGDLDGDGVPELPVSRVPDAGSATFMWSVLSTSPPGERLRERSGIRNVRRPFADGVFRRLPGRSPLFTSQPTAPNLPPFRLAGDVMYLMLHGTASDTATFTGEDPDGGYPTALAAGDVPRPCPPVVFAGCCYGALVVEERARDAQPGGVVHARAVADSIALSCLARGANAFVGCTGVHYSPTQPPLNYFGEPIHRAFVGHLLAGKPPAQALWAAKVDYAAGIPHRRGARIEEIAYEHKILRQFTCLGLGW